MASRNRRVGSLEQENKTNTCFNTGKGFYRKKGLASYDPFTSEITNLSTSRTLSLQETTSHTACCSPSARIPQGRYSLVSRRLNMPVYERIGVTNTTRKFLSCSIKKHSPTSCLRFFFHVSAFRFEFMFWKAKGGGNRANMVN